MGALGPELTNSFKMQKMSSANGYSIGSGKASRKPVIRDDDRDDRK